jgi:8-oxo-dGTP diphosphatase
VERKIRKRLFVSCAIIERSGLVLAARRSPAMAQPDKWEFPGGKLKPGETPAASLIREIQEELAVTIEVTEALPPSDYDYPAFALTLYPFTATIRCGEPKALEHSELIWLPPAELPRLDWAPADLPVLASYLGRIKKREVK